MQSVKKVLRWLNVLLILITFLAYLAPYISPVRFWLPSFFGMAYPALLLTHLGFIAFWLFFRKKYFLFSLGCILMGFTHLTSLIGFNFGTKAPESAITVMSFNTMGLNFLSHKDVQVREKKTADFLHFLNGEGAIDILCTQENTAYSSDLIAERFQFPYQHKIPYIGAAIFSRYPIVKTGNIAFDTRVNSCVWADIKLPMQTVRVYSMHLQSNQVSTQTEKVLAERQLREEDTWVEVRSIFGRIRHTSRIRAQQAESIAQHARQSPHPVILCGDLNEPPLSYTYRTLAKGLTDSFRAAGGGLGSTYAGRIPALRIDYILCDPGFDIYDTEILKKQYSDHYPVLTKLSWGAQ